MSVNVSLEILGSTQSELKDLIPKLPKAGNLTLQPSRDGLLFWKWKGFEISGVNEGLASKANPKNEFWPLNTDTAQAFSELLAAFAKVCPRRFTLYAAESGELPKRESQIQLTELLELIASGQLGNRVKYLVRT